ncbi:hypothetical protein VTK73DRAFT_3771 [Phialemonium thermophilum]|uniref:Uncharacterized protein n=1 Tax=Phialemonium thermophilum TaxID=223376 RepID=A0ABR3VEW6_9PEZI
MSSRILLPSSQIRSERHRGTRARPTAGSWPMVGSADGKTERVGGSRRSISQIPCMMSRRTLHVASWLLCTAHVVAAWFRRGYGTCATEPRLQCLCQVPGLQNLATVPVRQYLGYGACAKCLACSAWVQYLGYGTRATVPGLRNLCYRTATTVPVLSAWPTIPGLQCLCYSTTTTCWI